MPEVRSLGGSLLPRRPVIARFPKIQRVPLRRDFAATVVARKLVCHRPNCHCNPEEMSDVLYDCIAGLVYKNAGDYAEKNPDKLQDLAQSCWYHIFKRLHTYDFRRGAFSTWAWHVCRSTLNSSYARNKKHRDHLDDSGDEAFQTLGSSPEASPLEHQIKDAVKELIRRYPEKKKLTIKMFGDPSDPDFCLPRRICLAAVARATKVRYHEVYTFYHGPVRRTFGLFFNRDK